MSFNILPELSKYTTELLQVEFQAVFWIVARCCLVQAYQRFRGAYCHHKDIMDEEIAQQRVDYQTRHRTTLGIPEMTTTRQTPHKHTHTHHPHKDYSTPDNSDIFHAIRKTHVKFW